VRRVGAAASTGLRQRRVGSVHNGGQHDENRGRGRWQVGFEGLRDPVVAQIDIDVVVVSLLVAVMGLAAIVARVYGRRRLLAVEAQMHVRMCVRHAGEKNGKRGEMQS
jgi:hypothetical protein